VNRSAPRGWVRQTLRRSVGGWAAVGRVLAGIAAIAVGASIVGVGFVFPLWYLSTNYTAIFTWIVLGLIASLLVWLIASRIARSRPDARRVARAFVRIVATVVTLGAAYAASVLGAAGAIWAAVPIGILVVAFVGYGIGARARSR